MSVIDVDFEDVTESMFESLCLAQNTPCIIRRCDDRRRAPQQQQPNSNDSSSSSSGFKTENIRKALASVEASLFPDDVVVAAAAVENAAANSLKSNNNSNNPSSTLFNDVVRVEVSPREYEEMPLRRFLEKNRGLFRSLETLEGDVVMQQPAATSTTTTTTTTDRNDGWYLNQDGEGWYLKDWHFAEWWWSKNKTHNSEKQQHPFLYEMPHFMSKFATDDDLQRFQRSSAISASTTARPQKSEDGEHSLPQKFGGGQEYKFVYAGGAGSRTLPHFDVIGSYSWSMNLSGRKVWRFPKSEVDNELLLHEYFLRRPPCPVLLDEQLTTVVIQNPGDLFFVPALWLHSVVNEKNPVVSVNHNWCVVPYSLPHMMRLLRFEAKLAASLVGADVIAMFKQEPRNRNTEGRGSGGDDDDTQESSSPGEKKEDENEGEWALVLNRMLNGSSAWSLSAFRNFLNYAAMTYARDEVKMRVIERTLADLAALEKEVL